MLLPPRARGAHFRRRPRRPPPRAPAATRCGWRDRALPYSWRREGPMPDDLDDFDLEPTRRQAEEDTVRPYRPDPEKKSGGLLFPATLALVAVVATALLAVVFFVFRHPSKPTAGPSPGPGGRGSRAPVGASPVARRSPCPLSTRATPSSGSSPRASPRTPSSPAGSRGPRSSGRSRWSSSTSRPARRRGRTSSSSPQAALPRRAPPRPPSRARPRRVCRLRPLRRCRRLGRRRRRRERVSHAGAALRGGLRRAGPPRGRLPGRARQGDPGPARGARPARRTSSSCRTRSASATPIRSSRR